MKKESSIEETKFPELQKLVKDFNKQYPDKIQPVTNEVLFLLNEVMKCAQNVARESVFFGPWEKYNQELNRFPDLSTVTIKNIQINFGSSCETFESELLLDQIREILKDNLKRKYAPFRGSEKKRGNPRKPWLKIYSAALPIVKKLYKAGVTKDFLAHFFNQDPELFKRKIRTV